MSAPSTDRKAPKKTTGSSGKKQLVKDEPQPTPIVECPPELGSVARQEWDRLVPQLAELGHLTSLDRGPLAVYCTAYAQWLEAVDALQKYGPLLKSPNGHPVQSPYVSIATNQAQIMIRIATEFGFTPASRGRIPNPSKSDSWLLEIPKLEDLVN